MIPVVLESPYAGNVDLNVAYAKRCMLDCLQLGEAPYASHLLYTLPGLLDDTVLEERDLGMAAGFLWGDFAARTVVYTDLGLSNGMQRGIERAKVAGRPVEYRMLMDWQPSSAVQFPRESRYAVKCAELNTLAIELELAKRRHATLSNMWQALDHAQRLALFAAIFECAP
jgi:hypothetical protein